MLLLLAASEHFGREGTARPILPLIHFLLLGTAYRILLFFPQRREGMAACVRVSRGSQAAKDNKIRLSFLYIGGGKNRIFRALLAVEIKKVGVKG